MDLTVESAGSVNTDRKINSTFGLPHVQDSFRKAPVAVSFLSCNQFLPLECLLTRIQMPSSVEPLPMTAHEDLSGASRVRAVLAVNLDLCSP
jgi:hypothetical protein